MKMEKKEYKQPTLKIVELEERLLQDTSPNYMDETENEEAGSKRGTFNSDNDFDTEW